MTLLQRTADTLIQQGLAESYRDVSKRFFNRTENFFYKQNHHGRDIPTAVLLEALTRIRLANSRYDRFATIFESEQDELAKLERELTIELIERWNLNKEKGQTILAILAELH